METMDAVGSVTADGRQVTIKRVLPGTVAVMAVKDGTVFRRDTRAVEQVTQLYSVGLADQEVVVVKAFTVVSMLGVDVFQILEAAYLGVAAIEVLTFEVAVLVNGVVVGGTRAHVHTGSSQGSTEGDTVGDVTVAVYMTQLAAKPKPKFSPYILRKVEGSIIINVWSLL